MLRIGELAKLSQLSIKTLGYYAELDLVEPIEVVRLLELRQDMLKSETIKTQQQLNQLIAINLQRISAQLRPDIDISQVASFIVARFHGSSSLSKSSQNKELFTKVIKELCQYITHLRRN